jgi:Sterol-sensing domain of SREBP cleavage-activation
VTDTIILISKNEPPNTFLLTSLHSAALRKQDGNSDRDFLHAMRDVLIPITATSTINILLFGILNVSDIPIVYMTAQAGMCCVSLIYVILVLCFPAHCLIDLRRQSENRYDIMMCFKRPATTSTEKPIASKESSVSSVLSHYIYERTVLSSKLPVRTTTHSVVLGLATILVAIGGLGLSRRFVGSDFNDLFPSNNQAAIWTSEHSKSIPSWNVYINWGRNDITQPYVQLEMIKQFEDVIATNKISDVETKRLWIADFALWASKFCEDNLGRGNFDVSRCGRDQVYNFTSTCSATWNHNNYSLREANVFQYDSETCPTNKGGICRKLNDLDLEDKLIVQQKYLNNSADVTYCPVIEGWLPDKWEYCLRQWRYLTNTSNGGLFVKTETRTETECTGVYNKDEKVVWPISYSTGPPLVAYDVGTHSDTMDLLKETRKICDQNQDLKCWMEGKLNLQKNHIFFEGS